MRGRLVAAVLALALAAVCVRLGVWQLDRLEQRRERNAALEEAARLAPLLLDRAAVEAVAADPEAYLYRRVRASGRYLAQSEVVLRGRAHDGQPGVHLVTPLGIPGSPRAVLVDRGWAPSPDAATVDAAPLAEPGPREVSGVLLPIPDAGSDPLPVRGRNGAFSVRRLDVEALAERAGRPLVPLLLQQLPDSAASPLVRAPLPPPDEGPHLGYAIQWFSFALIAVAGALYVLLSRSRRPAP